MKRIRVVTNYVRQTTGKILHVGCVGTEKMDHPLWLHGHIVREASRQSDPQSRPVIGVDIDCARIQEMQQRGYLAETCDVSELAKRFPEGEFSLIIAGEIIEHVSDQMGFMVACRSVLAPDGVLLISTPNPFGATFALWYWITHQEWTPRDHVLWHSPRTMATLTESAGMRVAAIHYCTYGGNQRRWWVQPLTIAELWPGMRPAIVYEIRKG